MTFEVALLADVPVDLENLTGLRISETRLPRGERGSRMQGAYDSERRILFVPLHSEMRGPSEEEGHYLLVFGQDPVVIHGWPEASIQRSRVARSFATDRIAAVAAEAASVLFPALKIRYAAKELRIRQQDPRVRDQRAHAQFEDLLSKNEVRAQRMARDRWQGLLAPFRARQSPLSVIGATLQGVLDGTLGPPCTAAITVSLHCQPSGTAALTIANQGRSSVREFAIARDSIQDLLAPGIRNFAASMKLAGFDYEGLPDPDTYAKDVRIPFLAPGSATTVALAYSDVFEPVSGMITVQYRTGVLGWGRLISYWAFARVVGGSAG